MYLKIKNMSPRQSHHSVFNIWFSFLCVLKSLLGIARQWSCTETLSLKLWSHARILVSRTCAIKTKIILTELTLRRTGGVDATPPPHKVFF